MAIVKYGPLVTGILGQLAGSIFSQNASGPYVKGWARSSNPRVERQSIFRANWSALPTAWRGLTGAQQTAWDTYAALPAQQLTNALGENYFVSGFNWFITINQQRFSVGDSIRNAAPTVAKPATPTISTFSVFKTSGTSNTNVTFPSGTFSPNFRILLFISGPASQGTNVRNSRFRLTHIDRTVPLTQVFFQSQLEAAFGTIQVDQRFFVEMFKQDGQGPRSAAATASADAQL